MKGAAWRKRFYDLGVHRPDAALTMLVVDRLIAKSLVLPFHYLTALDAVQASNLPRAGNALAALSDAADKSLAYVPRFDGRTLNALDGSGSMNGRPLAIGSLFAAVLAKANAQADVLFFSNDANFVTLHRRDSTLTLTRKIARRAPGGGTNFHAIFQQAKTALCRQTRSPLTISARAPSRASSASTSPVTARCYSRSATSSASRASPTKRCRRCALWKRTKARCSAKSRPLNCEGE